MKKTLPLLLAFLMLLSVAGCAADPPSGPSSSETTTPAVTSATTLPSALPTPSPSSTATAAPAPDASDPMSAYKGIPAVEITSDLLLYRPRRLYSEVVGNGFGNASIPLPDGIDTYEVIGVGDGLDVYLSLSGGDPDAERRIRVASWSIPSSGWTALLEITVPAGRNGRVDLVNERYIVWYTSTTQGLALVDPEVYVHDRGSGETSSFGLPRWTDSAGAVNSHVPASKIVELDDVLYFEMITGDGDGFGLHRDIGAYDIRTGTLSTFREEAASPVRIEDRLVWCEADGNGSGMVRTVCGKDGVRVEAAGFEVEESFAVPGKDTLFVRDFIESGQLKRLATASPSGDGVDGSGFRMIRDGLASPLLVTRNTKYSTIAETDGRIVTFAIPAAIKPLYYDLDRDWIIELDEAVTGFHLPFVTRDHVMYVRTARTDTLETQINLCYARRG